MVTLRIWTRNGEQTINAPTNGKAMDDALRLGAYRAVDCVGEIFRVLEGDWVGCGFDHAPAMPTQAALLLGAEA